MIKSKKIILGIFTIAMINSFSTTCFAMQNKNKEKNLNNIFKITHVDDNENSIKNNNKKEKNLNNIFKFTIGDDNENSITDNDKEEENLNDNDNENSITDNNNIIRISNKDKNSKIVNMNFFNKKRKNDNENSITDNNKEEENLNDNDNENSITNNNNKKEKNLNNIFKITHVDDNENSITDNNNIIRISNKDKNLIDIEDDIESEYWKEYSNQDNSKYAHAPTLFKQSVLHDIIFYVSKNFYSKHFTPEKINDILQKVTQDEKYLYADHKCLKVDINMTKNDKRANFRLDLLFNKSINENILTKIKNEIESKKLEIIKKTIMHFGNLILTNSYKYGPEYKKVKKYILDLYKDDYYVDEDFIQKSIKLVGIERIKSKLVIFLMALSILQITDFDIHFNLFEK